MLEKPYYYWRVENKGELKEGGDDLEGEITNGIKIIWEGYREKNQIYIKSS